MSKNFEDSSLFWDDEQDSLNKVSTLEWIEPILKQTEKDPLNEKVLQENKKTTYIEEKRKEGESHTPIEPIEEEIGFMTNEYENWEGRIVDVEEEFIRARVINTQRHFSPRMMQISKSVFVSKGVVQPLSIGDMFELTYKTIQSEIRAKNNKISQRVQNVKSLRMIEPVRLSRSEIEYLAAKELEALSYLFE